LKTFIGSRVGSLLTFNSPLAKPLKNKAKPQQSVSLFTCKNNFNNFGWCLSCRSLYRLLNYIGWKPEELSPVLYINLSVAKNFPFYVQDIWKVRSCKT
jgi:hypothetical protein